MKDLIAERDELYELLAANHPRYMWVRAATNRNVSSYMPGLAGIEFEVLREGIRVFIPGHGWALKHSVEEAYEEFEKCHQSATTKQKSGQKP